MFKNEGLSLNAKAQQDQSGNCPDDSVVSVPTKSGYYWFNAGSKFSIDEIVLLHENINKEMFLYRTLAISGVPHMQIKERYPNAKWGKRVEK